MVICNSCNRKFNSTRGLNIHKSRMSCGSNNETNPPPSSLDGSLTASIDTSFKEGDLPLFFSLYNQDLSSDPSDLPITSPPLNVPDENQTLTPHFNSSHISNEVDTLINTELEKMRAYLKSQCSAIIEATFDERDSVISSMKDHLESLNTIIRTKDDDIRYLKDELKSKDEIINVLLNQQQNISSQETSKFLKPRNPVKINTTEHQFKIPLSNRFDILKADSSVKESISTTDSPMNLVIDNTIKHHNLTRNATSGVKNTTTNIAKKEKVLMLSDSMATRIIPGEFNKHTPLHQTYFQAFSGATSEKLKYRIEPTLLENEFDTAIIHCGTNDISPRSINEPVSKEEISSNILEIGKKCRALGVKKIFISGIIRRREDLIDQRRMVTNVAIKEMCIANEFNYIDNSNIPKSLLWKDGIHLSYNGIREFANNLIRALNSTPR